MQKTKIFYFDVETTGTDTQKCAIHQLSGMIVIDGQPVEEFDIRIRPHLDALIEDKALEVSGVTRELISTYPTMGDAYRQLTGILSKYVDKYDRTDKMFLAGYNNASFDDEFLRAFFVRNGDVYFGSWFWSAPIDAMVLAMAALMRERCTMPNFKLSTVAARLGAEVSADHLHDARYDIYLTREVCRKAMALLHADGEAATLC